MDDVSAEIDAAHRQVGHGTVETGDVRTVTTSRTYPAAIGDVWDACTNRERIPHWFLPISGDLRVGGHYQLEGNAGGTIEQCDPPASFSATWEFGGAVSWIGVRLASEADDRTRLELEHTVPVDDHWDQFGPGAVGVGWDLALMALGLHVGSGGPVDRDEAEAWSASAEGIRFVTLSSERWCEANIAGGEDADRAYAQAERTTDAYTAS
jgi:uncharacterized protein YndB with AHSA1/START domain